MSGRIRPESVRLKDASNVVPIRDGLISMLTGMGTTTDQRSYSRYFARFMTDYEIDQAYRGSWVMRKAIDKPATEMVREWRDWQADSDVIAKLEAEEKRLDLRNKVRRAECLRGLGGAGMVLYVGGSDDEQINPLDPQKLRAGDLKAIHVWHRSRFALGEMITNWGDPWFGHPSYYEIQLQGTSTSKPIRFHPSRVVAFKGEPVADIVGVDWRSAFWGQAKVQTIMDAIQNVDTADTGFAALISQARLRRIYIPKLLDLINGADGEAKLAKRLQAFALGESNNSVSWLDGGDGATGAERIDDKQVTWTGMPDIMAAYRTAAAAAADMPATVLWGISPQGMNATGDSDIQLWHKTIKGRQDLDLRPCMTQIDAALVPSALGKVDDAIWYDWAPLSSQSEKDEATTFFTFMQGVEKLQATNALPTIAFEKALQNTLEERSWLPGLGDALAEIAEDERFPSLSEPDVDANGNPIDPNALQAEGGDQTTGAEKPPVRRVANDGEVDDQSGLPFCDIYNPDQPRNEHGEWTATGAITLHVSRAMQSPKEKSTTSLGKVSSANAAAVLEKTGVHIAGFEREIRSDDIRHVMKSHGDPAREAARGQIAIRKADFEQIPMIVENAHSIKKEGDARSAKGLRLEYTASLGGHEYSYVETVSGGKVVALKSMRKK
jgi:phage-related protein (TIGR01555 family)